jgi:hypothetical protein
MVAFLATLDGATEVTVAGDAETVWSIESAHIDRTGQVVLATGVRVDGGDRPTHPTENR